MVSTSKKRQAKRRLINQSKDFDQDIIFGNAASEKQQIVEVNEGTVDQEFTVNFNSNNITANENSVNVYTLERCFKEKIDEKRNEEIFVTLSKIGCKTH